MTRVECEVRPVQRPPELRNYHDIPVGTEIPLEVLKNKDTMNRLLSLGRWICDEKQTGFTAVAFTQIPDKYFAQFGLSPTLNNCAYFGVQESEFSDTLVINPVLKPEHEFGSVASIEGCGSIDNGQTFMVVMRPLDIYIDGYAYREKRLFPLERLKHKLVQGLMAGEMQHEFHHLQGKTALDMPLMDFPLIPDEDWEKIDFFSHQLGFTVKQNIEFLIQKVKITSWILDREGVRYNYYPLERRLVPFAKPQQRYAAAS